MKISKISSLTGLFIVIANMIGTGVFTSLAFQVKVIQNPIVILLLWLIGGIIALSGAFTYSEIGNSISKSGGEYVFLTKIYHPIIGYLAAWISVFAGFSAPIALSAIAFVSFYPLFSSNEQIFGILLIGLISVVHVFNLRISSLFQQISTVFKIFIFVILIFFGLISTGCCDPIFIISEKDILNEIFSASFPISLIYVFYSYSGWNSAAYIIEEFEKPNKAIPYALIGGTILVTLIYSISQYVFLKHIPLSEIEGSLNIGAKAALSIFPSDFANVFIFSISLIFISGLSSMIWVGSRVIGGLANDYVFWKFLRSNNKQIPIKGIFFQFIISSIMILSSSFEQILIYCGVLISISSMLTVYGSFILRKQKIFGLYKTPIFPVFQIIFLIFSVYMISFIIIKYPSDILKGILILLIGMGTFFLNKLLH